MPASQVPRDRTPGATRAPRSERNYKTNFCSQRNLRLCLIDKELIWLKDLGAGYRARVNSLSLAES